MGVGASVGLMLDTEAVLRAVGWVSAGLALKGPGGMTGASPAAVGAVAGSGVAASVVVAPAVVCCQSGLGRRDAAVVVVVNEAAGPHPVQVCEGACLFRGAAAGWRSAGAHAARLGKGFPGTRTVGSRARWQDGRGPACAK